MCKLSAVRELAIRRASTLKQLADRTKQCVRTGLVFHQTVRVLLLAPLFFLSLSSRTFYYRAGQEGFEPPTAGFGDRNSAN